MALTENKDSTKYFSERQEQYVAKILGGRVQPGSGNGKYSKSDVRAGDFLIECKTAMTAKQAFSVKKDWLEKLRAEALMNHKSMYTLAFNFGAEAEHNYFVLDEKTFILLKEAFEELNK